MRIKQNQIILAAALGLGFALAGPASAFGLPSLGSLTGKSESSGGDVSADVSSFVAKTDGMRKTVGIALAQLNVAFANKEARAILSTRVSALTATTDTKESGALAADMIKTEGAEAAKNMNAADAKEKMEKLSPAMKEAVSKALLALGISALQAPDLARTGQGLVQKVGVNPMEISKVVPVKDALPVLADIGANVPTIVQAGFKLMREVNVNPGTPTKDAAAVTASALVLE